MNETKKTRIFSGISLALNTAIVMMTAYSIVEMLVGNIAGNMSNGTIALRYFTNLSNILVALTALFVIPFDINSLISGKDEIPYWVLVFKFVGTTAVTVTFLTVMLFLGPTIGYAPMLAGPNIFLHLIIPIVAIISLVGVETGKKVSFRASIFGLIPTVVYSIIYVSCVVFAGIWDDFYGFTFGGKNWAVPLSMVGMYLATFLFCLGLKALQNVFFKLRNK